MIIQFTLQSTTDGSYLTGQASNTTVYISKDGGAFAATTNAVAEIGRGLYKVELTAAESAFTTLVYNPVCTGAQNNLYSIDAPTDISGLSTFDPSTDTVTISSDQASTLATSQDVANIATTAGAIKAKTDNLPANPAAVTDVTTAQAAIIAAIPDISSIATKTDLSNAEDTIIGNIVSAMPDISGLSTFNPETDAVTINSVQAATMVTADVSELATTADISDAVTDIKNYGQEHWQTANLSGLATSSELANTQEDIISAMPTTDITAIKAGLYNWELVKDGSTESIIAKSGSSTVAQSTITRNSAGEIVKMEETE